MLWSPRIRMILPRVGARPNCHEAVMPALVGKRLTHADKVRVEGRVMLIPLVEISSRGVGLPDFDQRFTNRPAILIPELSAHNDAFTEWLAFAMMSEVERCRIDDVFLKNRSRDFRKSIRKRDEWLCGSTPQGRNIGRVEIFRLRAWRRFSIASQLLHFCTRLNAFQNQGDALTHSDAHGTESVAAVRAFELVDGGCCQARTTGA